jgi:CCR4-NOT transcriptional regulation complex NOT5 subunit
MHGVPGGKVESESFSHDFSLPKCYNVAKFREHAVKIENGQSAMLSSQKCKLLPDKVLFYIFYNMPHDRGQISAYHELKSRQWIYLSKQMRWIKPNPQSSKKDAAKRKVSKEKKETEGLSRTAIMFNP